MNAKLSSRTRSRGRNRAPGSMFGMFLLANILPLGAIAALVVMHLQGQIDLGDLPVPQGFWMNVGGLVAAGAGLILVVSFSLPVAHGWVRTMELGMAGRRDRLLNRAPGSKVLGVLALPFLLLGYVLAWPVRAALIVLAFVLIAVAAVFMVRLVEPSFLQVWIDRVLSYRP